MKIFIVIITALLVCSGIVYAQGINVELSLEAREYSIGDWIPITITAEYDSKIIVYPPEPGENPGFWKYERPFISRYQRFLGSSGFFPTVGGENSGRERSSFWVEKEKSSLSGFGMTDIDKKKA